MSVPAHATVVVIGAGPAGSYAASLLQREGIHVVLFDSQKFPRYHIGESMLPSLRGYLKFIDLEDQFKQHGFTTKPGACFKLSQGMRPSLTNFIAVDTEFSTWNVIRSEMDDILFRHAQEQGVLAFDETKIQSITFEGDPATSRPIAAHWANKQGDEGEITFDWLIDASGRNGLMSTKYMKNRIMRESLKNVAVWGYWTGAHKYRDGTDLAGTAWFEALADEQGWAWTIPLHDGTTSVGFVMHQDASNAKRAKLGASGNSLSLTEHYLDQLQYVPGVRDLIGDAGQLVTGSVKSASDYSYYASKYSGDHYRIVGDAANFIDPFFSSGVHIAMTGAMSAAITICASIKNQVTEELAQQWHDEKVGVAHTRFLLVVLGAYQQMHLQSVPVLGDIGADNFDKAFEVFRPVIYGLTDNDNTLSHDESTQIKVAHMMDALQSYFDPVVDVEAIKTVHKQYGADPVDLEAPVLGHEKIQHLVKEDELARRVLKKFDAVRMFGSDMRPSHMGHHPILGYCAHIEKGQLGLLKEDSVQSAH